MKKYTFISFLLICLPLLGISQGSLTLGITGYDAKCNGSASGSAKVISSGGTMPYTYTWAPVISTSDSVSGLAVGTYTVTVTDNNGNTASGSVTIGQPAPLVVSIDSIVVFPCFKPTGGACGTCDNTLWAVVSGGTAPYSYLWSPGDSVTTDTLLYACYLEFGVAVTDKNGCIITDSINVTVPDMDNNDATGIKELSSTQGIEIYPNPAINQINISIDKSVTDIKSLEVYDLMGRKLLDQKIDSSKRLVTIDISRFVNGNYLLRIAGGASQKTANFSILR